MNVLFWNINKKNLSAEINELANLLNIDIIILCEYDERNFGSLDATYKLSHIACEKVKVFTKLRSIHIRTVAESYRWTIREIKHPLYTPFLIAAVHLPSKNNFSPASQSEEAGEFRGVINKVQQETSIKRTIIVGDLNMNPFESGVISIRGFHATADKKIALKEKRRVQGREYEYFYNPMWNFLGDESVGNVPGTYFHNTSEHVGLNWHILDQVLISPSLIENVSNSDIEIITESTTFSLLRANGRIDSSTYSDHLPIKFSVQPNLL